MVTKYFRTVRQAFRFIFYVSNCCFIFSSSAAECTAKLVDHSAAMFQLAAIRSHLEELHAHPHFGLIDRWGPLVVDRSDDSVGGTVEFTMITLAATWSVHLKLDQDSDKRSKSCVFSEV